MAVETRREWPEETLGERLRRAGVRVAAAGLVLSLIEVVGLIELAVPLDGPRLLTLVASMVTLVFVAEGVISLCYGVAWRLAPRWAPWTFTLFTTPVLLAASERLFSGHRARQLPAVELLELGLFVLLILAVRYGVALYAHLSRRRERETRPRLLLAAGLLVALSWVDTHVEVGHYPSFHFLLGAALVFGADMLARLLVPRGAPLPVWVGALCVPLVVGASLWTARKWDAPETVGLVSYGNGLMPKFREALVLAVDPGPALARESPGASRPRATAVADVVSSTPEADFELGAAAAEFAFTPTDAPELERIRAATRHVVFVLVDALRNDHVGPRDDGPSLTPAIDAVTAEGVRFDTVYSPSDHTGRSMPSLMTSLPRAVVERACELEVTLDSWLTLLGRGGYRTLANGGCDYISLKYPAVLAGDSFGAHEVGILDARSEALVDEIVAFIVREPGTRTAVYTHWLDTHVGRPKDAPAVYAENVRVVDGRLGRLVAELRAAGVWEQTLLVVTSDHGYSLGEANRFRGAQGCGELSLRIPLVMHVPGLAEPPDGASARVVRDAVSGHDVTSTILDAALPDARALVSSPGLFALLFDEEGGRDRDVFASTGRRHALRRDALKLVVDEDHDTALVFDVVADPSERSPVQDPTVVSEMWTGLQRELERHARLGHALAAEGRRDIDAGVLAALSARELPVEDVAPLVDELWSHGAPTRRLLLRTIVRRHLVALGPRLARVARDGWDDDDQRLLVLRAWCDDEDAARELAARWDELGGIGRRWLAELFIGLPDECAESIAPGLAVATAQAWGEDPALGSPEERLVALTSWALAARLRGRAPPEVAPLLVDLFNAYSTRDPPPSFTTLAGRRFIRRDLVTRLGDVLPADDVSPLAGLAMNKDAAIRIPEICRARDSAASRAFLLDLVARWHVPGDEQGHAIGYMIKTLRTFEDEDFRRRANALIQARFPRVPAFE